MGAHEAFAAFPLSGGAATIRSTQRAYVVKRTALCLADSEDLQAITVADSGLGTGAVPLYVIQSGRLFALDALDVITAHDGTTCLVSEDGKRYKVVTFSYPDSVLDKDLTAPPDSPEASVGDAFIVGVAATDDWAGQDNKIAVQTERGWQFVTVPIGRLIYVEDETAFYHRNAGGTWTAGVGSLVLGSGVVKPSSLIGGGGRVHWIVENQTTNAPPAVVNGAAYVIGSSPTGDWSGHAGKIAHGEGDAWVIYAPAEGWTAYDKGIDRRLIYTGTGWSGGADGMVLIATQLASNSPTIDFVNGVNGVVLDDTYDAYEIRISSLKPAVDDATLVLRVGTGATPTWQSSNYYWGYMYMINAASAASSTSASEISLSAGIGNAAGENFNGTIKFDNPDSTDIMQILYDAAHVLANSASVRLAGHGRYTPAGAVTGLRFYLSSGNISAGRFSLYGLRKS